MKIAMSTPPRAKKSLGQHFLKDTSISKRIVDLLGVTPTDRVLEIGPGPGALTGLLLAQHPAELHLVEKDSYWAAHHAASAHLAPVPLHVAEKDALTIDWEAMNGPWKIISNLPYNVGSVILWDMVHRLPELARGVFMVQKEVAERLAAEPGGKDYGALSVWVQSFTRVEWGFVVPPGAFTPPPKVDSAVVRLTALAPDKRPVAPQPLAELTKRLFQQRRKQLQSIIKKSNMAHLLPVLESMGVAGQNRPETLTPLQFQTLARAVSGSD